MTGNFIKKLKKYRIASFFKWRRLGESTRNSQELSEKQNLKPRSCQLTRAAWNYLSQLVKFVISLPPGWVFVCLQSNILKSWQNSWVSRLSIYISFSFTNFVGEHRHILSVLRFLFLQLFNRLVIRWINVFLGNLGSLNWRCCASGKIISMRPPGTHKTHCSCGCGRSLVFLYYVICRLMYWDLFFLLLLVLSMWEL